MTPPTPTHPCINETNRMHYQTQELERIMEAGEAEILALIERGGVRSLEQDYCNRICVVGKFYRRYGK